MLTRADTLAKRVLPTRWWNHCDLWLRKEGLPDNLRRAA